jgi:hypothetical protein
VRPYKGLDILLRALAEAGPQISLTVAGEIWDGREEIQRLISDLGLQDRVTLSGGYVPTAEIPAVFAAADALVLPYRSATASQNALVAFQFGLPVIASRAGAIADAVDDGVNGILCAPGDAADLARAIRELYQPGTLERLRAGVRPPDPRPLWDDYLAAVGKAASAGRSPVRDGRLRRQRPATVEPSQGHITASQSQITASQAQITASQDPSTAGQALLAAGAVLGPGRCLVAGRPPRAVAGRGPWGVLRLGRCSVVGLGRCSVPGRGRCTALGLPGRAGPGPGAALSRSGGAGLGRVCGPAARHGSQGAAA